MMKIATMIDLFLHHPLVFIAGIGIAIFAGVIGCFVVWRRMSYLGDSLAHSALLGIALGLFLSISSHIGIFITCAVFAVLLIWLQNIKVLTTDTLLGILAHAGLSLGIIAVGLLGRSDIDEHAFLFGDILKISMSDVWWLYIGGAVLIILLIWNWSALVLMTVNEDLAKADNVNVFYMRILLVCLMTIIISVSVQIIGILLITSLLIIPAATARQMARSPEAMAVLACLFGVVAVLIGLYVSLEFGSHVAEHLEHAGHGHDEAHEEHNEHAGHGHGGHGGGGNRIPAGASIVAASSFMFALVFPVMAVVKLVRKNRA